MYKNLIFLKKKKKKLISHKTLKSSINIKFKKIMSILYLRRYNVVLFFKNTSIECEKDNDLILWLLACNFAIKLIKKKWLNIFFSKKLQFLVNGECGVLNLIDIKNKDILEKKLVEHNKYTFGYFWNNIFFSKEDLDLTLNIKSGIITYYNKFWTIRITLFFKIINIYFFLIKIFNGYKKSNM